MRRQSGRMIEPIIFIALALLAGAIFVPQIMDGEGFFTSLSTTVIWMVAIFGGIAMFVFLAMLSEIVRDWRATPPAVRAAQKRNALDALRNIKPERLDTRAADRLGNTALHITCVSYEEERKRGALEVVDFLLQHGADVDAANTYNETPLKLAVEREYGVNTVRRLLAAGAKPQQVLNSAAGKRGGDAIEIVKALLDAGASASVPDLLGTTPLHQAASYGTLETVRELLARGAEINARDDTGKTPLHTVLRQSSLSLNETRTVEIISTLVAAGADRDVVDGQGRTPRALAEASGILVLVAAMNDVSGMLPGSSRSN